MKKRIKYIFFAASLFIISCSSKIRIITAYEDQNGIKIKKKETYFNKRGNEIKEITYGKLFNTIKTIDYHNALKASKSNCRLYPDNKSDCNFNSKFTYDTNNAEEIETVYLKDSLIWSICRRKTEKGMVTIKTFSWEQEAAKIPNYREAFVTTDTLLFDNKHRLVKQVSYRQNSQNPFTNQYTYTDDGYNYEISGTRMDTIYHFKYSNTQKVIVKNMPDYEFYYPKQLIYKIEYF